MPINRFFHPIDLTQNISFYLPKEEIKHLKKVLRKLPGDQIDVVNGRGTLAQGIIQDDYSIHVQSTSTQEKPKKETILIQAIGLQTHLEMIIEKGTEIGIDQFWLFFSTHSTSNSLSENKRLRLDKITKAALKQCGRLHLPKITIFPSKEELPQISSPPLLMHEQGNSTSTISSKTHSPTAIVGAESGLTEEEIQFFINKRQAYPVKIHENTLRSETAALVSSIIIHKMSRDDLIL